MNLHHNITRLRNLCELTVREATKCGGLHEASWSDIERGRNPNPTPRTLEKIAAALGVKPADLFVDEDGESVSVATD